MGSCVNPCVPSLAWVRLGNRHAVQHYAMRAFIIFLSGAAVALLCVWPASCVPGRLAVSAKHTFSSFDPPRGPAAEVQFDAGRLKLADADLDQVLNLYQEISARTLIRATNLPPVKISLHNQTPLTRVETLQLLDTTLMQNGITMVLVGDATVKAVPNREAIFEIPPTIQARAEELPDSSSYMTCTIALKKAPADQMMGMLGLVSRMQKSIVYVPTGNLLILRDYSSNIRQMLRLIQQADRDPLHWLDVLNPVTNTAGRASMNTPPEATDAGRFPESRLKACPRDSQNPRLRRRISWSGEHMRPRMWRSAPRRPLLPAHIQFLLEHTGAAPL